MGSFITGQAAKAQLGALLDQVDLAYREMTEVCTDEIGNAFRVELAERLETQERINRALMYRVFGQIADPPDETAMAPRTRHQLCSRLRIPDREAKRRFKTAARITPRRQLCGPPLPPPLPTLAQSVGTGTLGEDHLRAITRIMDLLPVSTSASDRDEVETTLVREAAKHDADFVTQLGRAIDDVFNPDGHYNENYRARRRGLTLSPQHSDGMSRLTGWIDPETRAYLEAATAAVRPGRHLPVVADDPEDSNGLENSNEQARDDRSPAQRCHDGLKLGLKAALASTQLGTHRGHPVTVIVSTTLAELNQAAHAVQDPAVSMPAAARTGGASALPMRDLIRMATDAIHYLAVFDEHTGRPLYLGRQTRIATRDQRMICYARDRGCTHPDCLTPGYQCEVHHSPDWATAEGRTDADSLFFACGPHHSELTNGHCDATPTDAGRLAWTIDQSPPRVNRVHHPDELLKTDPAPRTGAASRGPATNGPVAQSPPTPRRA